MGHRGNPAAGLRVQLLFGAPVLLSGLSSLVLSKAEKAVLHHHYKVCLERIQKLHRATPECVVNFLGGSLPLTALLEIHQLAIFGMISRLGPDHILHRHATNTLSLPTPPSHSWFSQIKTLCNQYQLPCPLYTLSNPPTKDTYKREVKSRVTNYWENKLRMASARLLSLEFFKPQFYNLTRPHPIWTTAGNNPYEVEKACVQAKLLSGRYRSCWLSRHWSGDPTGSCSLPTCRASCPTPGTVAHIMLACDDLSPARSRIVSLWAHYMVDKPVLLPIVRHYTTECQNPTTFLQFIFDCSVLPEVIAATQIHGNWVLNSLFYMTRSFCYSIHKLRYKLLGKWNHKK